jgi:uncharacterized OsmC-like protein
MSDPVSAFDVHIEQISGYEFRVKFDKPQYPELHLDEPPPLGKDTGPNPARVLAAAIGDCLSASLLFCLSRSGIHLSDLKSDVHVEIVRNEQKRLRIGKIDVKLHPRVDGDAAQLMNCLEAFEDFCVVTQSVRQGLEVNVSVEPQA